MISNGIANITHAGGSHSTVEPKLSSIQGNEKVMTNLFLCFCKYILIESWLADTVRIDALPLFWQESEYLGYMHDWYIKRYVLRMKDLR